jgi:hypothetical protein
MVIQVGQAFVTGRKPFGQVLLAGLHREMRMRPNLGRSMRGVGRGGRVCCLVAKQAVDEIGEPPAQSDPRFQCVDHRSQRLLPPHDQLPCPAYLIGGGIADTQRRRSGTRIFHDSCSFRSPVPGCKS